MEKLKMLLTLETAIIAAFTIAIAFVWKDVIIETIEHFVPPGEDLLVKYIVAILATVIMALVIYFTQKTENEAEFVIHKIEKIRKKP